MKMLFTLAMIVTVYTADAQLIMTPREPNAGNKNEIIIEFKNFIIYNGDTLNRKDASGKKTGEWIEYQKNYLRKPANGVTVIDSASASYVVTERGIYINGLQNGLWISYYPDGRIRESVKVD